MASLCCDSRTLADGSKSRTWRVLIGGGKRPRHTIRLGKVSQRIAETARLRIEAMETAQLAGHSVDAETALWLAKISDTIHSRIAKAGLVEPREQAEEWTLSRLLDAYIDSRDDVKPNTLIAYRRSRRQLETFFGRDRLIATVTEGDADDFKQWLLRRSAQATTSREIKRARQFFKAAVRRRLIPANPFEDVKAGSQTNPSRKFFVERETIEAVIAACPNNDWRLIFAFARYAGLRIPSELDELKWSDINWERGRFVVQVPKKAHLPGHETRVVPIFPELRPHLERAFEEAPEGSVYVVPRAHGCPNLRRYADQIIKRAGVAAWPKLFVNCRASRETELMRQHPAHVVHSWIGHTATVAEAHYLQVTESDFCAAQKAAQSVPVRGHLEPSRLSENREKRGKHGILEGFQYPREEANLSGFSREKQHSSDPRGAKSGALSEEIALLIAMLDSLPAEERAAVLEALRQTTERRA